MQTTPSVVIDNANGELDPVPSEKMRDISVNRSVVNIGKLLWKI